MVTDQWGTRMQALGAFIRSRRKLANLSLRQLAELSTLSNPYLSQLERGMHQPSVHVLKLISGAPDVSAQMHHCGAGGAAGAVHHPVAHSAVTHRSGSINPL
jgi:helix-turn-helix protein